MSSVPGCFMQYRHFVLRVIILAIDFMVLSNVLLVTTLIEIVSFARRLPPKKLLGTNRFCVRCVVNQRA